MKKRLLAGLLGCLLSLGMILPQPAAAASVYFTSINDNLTQLTAESMPFWSGGALYVPYTVFDRSSNGQVDLGLSCSYNRSNQTVTIMDPMMDSNQILVVDVKKGTCRDYMSGDLLPGRVIVRNGIPFLSLSVTCDYFGLKYSYNSVPYVANGFLVRIKNGDVILSDGRFMEAASELIQKRLQEYTQSMNPPADQEEPSVTPDIKEENPAHVSTYLAFRCRETESLSRLLDVLGQKGTCGAFFVTPEVLAQEDGMIRRLLGTGHSLGIWGEGSSQEDVEQNLDRGRELLQNLFYQDTVLAYTEKEYREKLTADGWICWQETLAIETEPSRSAGSIADRVMKRLDGRSGNTYLTMDCSLGTVWTLPTLLERLEENRFDVRIPLETRL